MFSDEPRATALTLNLKYASQLKLGLVGTTPDQLAKVVDVLQLDYDEIFD